MQNVWETIFFVVLALLCIQFLLVLFFSFRSRKIKKINSHPITEISVVIPFHNERAQIHELLKSLNEQVNWQSKIELLFVDDASTDETANFVRSVLKRPHSVVVLEQKSGKKQAIHAAIEKAKFDFILTLDADVKLPQNYFSALFQLPQQDMVILPVTMTASGFLARMGAIEFNWLQLLTFGARKPVLANGANLVFRKTAYLSAYKERTDFNEVSGDDVFLMQSFLSSGKLVHRYNSAELAVETGAPQTFRALLQQRKRWIGKFAKMADTQSILAALFLVVLQVGFLLSVAGAIFYPAFLLLIALKFLTEYTAAVIYRPADYKGNAAVVLAHQFWYPVYLFMLFLPLAKEEKWRNQ